MHKVMGDIAMSVRNPVLAVQPSMHVDGAGTTSAPVTHLDLWKVLVEAEEDSIQQYFPYYSLMVRIACHPITIWIGFIGSLWTAIAEVIVSVKSNGEYLSGYVTGFSAIGIVVSLHERPH
jgi:hypothetical protein